MPLDVITGTSLIIQLPGAGWRLTTAIRHMFPYQNFHTGINRTYFREMVLLFL
jgi:hypothetical protein